MFVKFDDWNHGLVVWGFALASLGLFYYFAWRQYRGTRNRLRYDRVRQRQRREYWGVE